MKKIYYVWGLVLCADQSQEYGRRSPLLDHAFDSTFISKAARILSLMLSRVELSSVISNTPSGILDFHKLAIS
jgi:hypothetical protein